jgi:hypothetical protein
MKVVNEKHPWSDVRMGRRGGEMSPLHRIAQYARSCCLSPRRSHGMLAGAENFHISLCPKKGMGVGMTRQFPSHSNGTENSNLSTGVYNFAGLQGHACGTSRIFGVLAFSLISLIFVACLFGVHFVCERCVKPRRGSYQQGYRQVMHR